MRQKIVDKLADLYIRWLAWKIDRKRLRHLRQIMAKVFREEP